VFAAFSGSHQDAIAKGMHWRSETGDPHWTVPYLPIDPSDIGRTYETDVIRINSQSGKGGIGYILETRFGYDLPRRMRERVGYLVKGISDQNHKELSPDEVYLIFKQHYIDITAPLNLTDVHYVQHNGIEATIDIEYNGVTASATNSGNGRLDAVSNAVRSYTGLDYTLNTYSEHALEVGSTSKAVSYVEVVNGSQESFWGVGIDNDIMTSSVKAFVSAINNMLNKQG
ncbi:MAG: 2-isopropylmalate synthase, partial [Oscillospiraceae bacterium]|nr:2-isopropylmalate synthase [Oscillospiraceae bacterium]